MKLLDQIIIKHKNQEKKIELYHGDLSDMPPEHAVDILVVSAWPDDYAPIKGTLIGALNQNGVSVSELATSKETDLRSAFSCWMSKEITSDEKEFQFKQILCFEPYSRGEPAEVIGDIFQSLISLIDSGSSDKKIAMPLVATGQQNAPIADVIEPLLEAAVHWLELGLPVEVLKIVEYSELKAAELKGAFAILKKQLALNSQSVSSEYKYDLFLSYSHKNKDEAVAILEELKSLRPNLRVFFDSQDLNTGSAWQQELYEALDDCEKVVAIYSPTYITSKVCKEEFNIALFRHREADEGVLVPIYIQDADLPTYMKLVQFVDFRGMKQSQYRSACEGLLQSLNK